MAKVLRVGDAETLHLRGRSASVLLSGEDTDQQLTVRVVEVDPEPHDGEPRPLHVHEGIGEFIWILKGNGSLHCDAGVLSVYQGEGIYIQAGELHKIMPIGDDPLHLLCAFPTGDIALRTRE